MQIGNFILQNADKLHRVINGTIGSNGRMEGGIGEKASDEEKLAEYDRLGGLITTLEGEKIETGTFYDFVKRQPKKDITVRIAKAPNKNGVKIKEENVGDVEAVGKKKGKKVVVKYDDEDE